jgi:hypothetical protein
MLNIGLKAWSDLKSIDPIESLTAIQLIIGCSDCSSKTELYELLKLPFGSRFNTLSEYFLSPYLFYLNMKV